MWTTINGLLQVIGTLLVRLSACLLVLRMPPAGHTKQLHARAIYLLMAFFCLVSTASFFIMCFRCTPVQGLWDTSLHARCIPIKTWDTIQKVSGSESLAFVNNQIYFALIKNSLRSRHELPDCQPPLYLFTQPPDQFQGEMGGPDHRPLSLWVSSTFHSGTKRQDPAFSADWVPVRPAFPYAECLVEQAVMTQAVGHNYGFLRQRS